MTASLRVFALLVGWLTTLPLGVLAHATQSSGDATTGRSETTVTVRGVVRDQETGAAIPDVILRITGTQSSAASDASGRFSLFSVPRGTRQLEATHAAYASLVTDVDLTGPEDVDLELKMQSKSFELDAWVVEADTRSELERRSTGASYWEDDRSEIERAIGTSRHMGDLIRQTIPGLRLRQATNLSLTATGLEFRAVGSLSIVNSRPCNHPRVFVDGVPISDPQYFYGSTGLENLERIQVIPPGDAGTRFGAGSLYGVILVETRRPGPRRNTAFEELAPRNFDWSLDPQGHPLAKSLSYATLGNAVGLAAGIAVARQCIEVADRQIRGGCGTLNTALAAGFAILSPAVASALGARLGGTTATSKGRLLPAALGAGLVLVPGYAFSLSTVGEGSETVQTVGSVMLVAGVPLASALLDRLYRKLR